jgi:transcriptional regulator with XRE-family HTH domain
MYFNYKKFKKEFLQNNMTAREFAKISGLGIPTVYLLLRGTDEKVYINTVIKVAQAFGLSAWDFMTIDKSA